MKKKVYTLKSNGFHGPMTFEVNGKQMTSGFGGKDFKAIKSALSLFGCYEDGFTIDISLEDNHIPYALDNGYIVTRMYKTSAGVPAHCSLKMHWDEQESFTGDSASFLEDSLKKHMAYSAYKMKMAVVLPGDPVVSEKLYKLLSFDYPISTELEAALMGLFDDAAGDDL